MNAELIQKAREAKSAEELMELAKANGEDITSKQAEEYYERLHTAGELSDDELDGAAGGGCGSGGIPADAKTISNPFLECCDNYTRDWSTASDNRCCLNCVSIRKPSFFSNDSGFYCGYGRPL